ncbi:hypothetical protein Glove_595g15 [Diversispora epigaea]|uniref:Protein kinase domain-containing protein n=1 Tax=Diversispora epigaea TaxID=1348612 RepID=A0A397G7P9_9GLOM|nr:hypothetical protein Glove_595g15 [Diversispora epigaea]
MISSKKHNFQKKSESRDFLAWVPYENLTNVEFIARGGFSQIYKATWKKQIYKANKKNKKGYFFETTTEVVLKVLNNSQNVDTEFFKELKYTYQFGEYTIKCHGVTQIPQTKNYAFILDYATNGDLHQFLNKNFAEITLGTKLKF